MNKLLIIVMILLTSCKLLEKDNEGTIAENSVTPTSQDSEIDTEEEEEEEEEPEPIVYSLECEHLQAFLTDNTPFEDLVLAGAAVNCIDSTVTFSPQELSEATDVGISCQDSEGNTLPHAPLVGAPMEPVNNSPHSLSLNLDEDNFVTADFSDTTFSESGQLEGIATIEFDVEFSIGVWLGAHCEGEIEIDVTSFIDGDYDLFALSASEMYNNISCGDSREATDRFDLSSYSGLCAPHDSTDDYSERMNSYEVTIFLNYLEYLLNLNRP